MSENAWKSFWKFFFLTAWISFIVLLILKLVGIIQKWLIVFMPFIVIIGFIVLVLLLASLVESFRD